MSKEAPQPVATEVYRERTTCRCCDSTSLIPVLDLGMHYLPNFVKERDETLPKAPLDIVSCSDCGLLQLRHTTTPDLLWREYWYRSGINQTMRDALKDVVKDGLQYHSKGRWVDIGANDGTLLEAVPRTFEKWAFEPALNLQPFVSEHADHVVPDYFAAEPELKGKCDVITSCAMFYDLDDPNEFVAAVADSLTLKGVWINQLSHTPDMLRLNAFDNICSEHVCYYDIESIRALYARHGLWICSVKLNDINGGSFRVAAMKLRSQACSLASIPTTTQEETRLFCDRVVRWKSLMQRLLTSGPVGDDPVWLYGASTKASTFLQYLDLEGRFIAAAERNPTKVGLQTAGTWIKIESEAAFRAEKPPWALVGPWSFKHELVAREKDLRGQGTTFIFPLPNPEFVL